MCVFTSRDPWQNEEFPETLSHSHDGHRRAGHGVEKERWAEIRGVSSVFVCVSEWGGD